VRIRHTKTPNNHPNHWFSQAHWG